MLKTDTMHEARCSIAQQMNQQMQLFAKSNKQHQDAAVLEKVSSPTLICVVIAFAGNVVWTSLLLAMSYQSLSWLLHLSAYDAASASHRQKLRYRISRLCDS